MNLSDFRDSDVDAVEEHFTRKNITMQYPLIWDLWLCVDVDG